VTDFIIDTLKGFADLLTRKCRKAPPNSLGVIFRNLPELGRRAVGQLSEDSQLPSRHHYQDRLAVSAYLDRAHYPTRLNADPVLFRSLGLRFHKTLPAWNYTITSNLCSYYTGHLAGSIAG
jgi:hypothetical protein